MQRLTAAQRRGISLQSYSDNIIQRLLRGQRNTAGLDMKAQHHRTRIFGPETLFHYLRPRAARRPELGYLFHNIGKSIEKETEPWREGIYIKPAVNAGLHISDTVRESKGRFLRGGGTGFPDMIPPAHPQPPDT